MAQLGYSITEIELEDKLKFIRYSELDSVYIAIKETELVGVISCHVTTLFHQLGSLGRIISFVIHENYRGMGIGKSLISVAEEFFKSKFCVKVEVTSGDHRSEAHSFYQSCGYKMDERRFIKVF